VDLVTTNTEKVSVMVKIQKVKEIELKLDIIEGGGATLENTKIDVDITKIQISGSDTELESLNHLNIGTIDLSEVLEDQTLTFPIVLPEGVANQTGVEQVTVKIELPRLKTKTLRVTAISGINVPAGLQADIITKALQVTVRGPSRLIDKIKAENVSAVINLAEAQTGSVTMKAEIRVSEDFGGVGALDTYMVSAELHS
jgi:YbbR domain-containing protein